MIESAVFIDQKHHYFDQAMSSFNISTVTAWFNAFGLNRHTGLRNCNPQASVHWKKDGVVHSFSFILKIFTICIKACTVKCSQC